MWQIIIINDNRYLQFNTFLGCVEDLTVTEAITPDVLTHFQMSRLAC